MRSIPRREGGQSTVEFALIVPLIFIVLLALVQVGVVIHGQIAVTHTAREVARVLAVDPTADPQSAAVAASGLRADALEVETSFAAAGAAGRQLVLVTVRYVVPSIGGLGAIVGEVSVSAEAAMLVES